MIPLRQCGSTGFSWRMRGIWANRTALGEKVQPDINPGCTLSNCCFKTIYWYLFGFFLCEIVLVVFPRQQSVQPIMRRGGPRSFVHPASSSVSVRGSEWIQAAQSINDSSDTTDTSVVPQESFKSPCAAVARAIQNTFASQRRDRVEAVLQRKRTEDQHLAFLSSERWQRLSPYSLNIRVIFLYY